MKNLWVLGVLALIFAGCQESLEDRCERETKEITAKRCPMVLDQNTTMDSITFDRNTHTLHYYYKLTGAADRGDLLEKTDAKGTLLKALKNNTETQMYKENKYNFTYTFRSEKDPNKIWLEVTFTEKDY
jgi:ADP-ribose pyrophosphatase YjhB (NUDIX family)